jgi:hypothetical protein
VVKGMTEYMRSKATWAGKTKRLEIGAQEKHGLSLDIRQEKHVNLFHGTSMYARKSSLVRVQKQKIRAPVPLSRFFCLFCGRSVGTQRNAGPLVFRFFQYKIRHVSSICGLVRVNLRCRAWSHIFAARGLLDRGNNFRRHSDLCKH